MKVLHVIPAVAPRYGGPSHAVYAMGQALQAAGVEIFIATTAADGPAALPVPLGRPLPYHDVPTLFFPQPWTEAFKYSRPCARWLDAHVGEFDLVHIHAVFSHSSLAAADACQRHAVPYLVRPLGSLDPWSLKQKAPHKRLLWHLGVGRMLRRAAAIHYTTLAEQQLAEGALGLSKGAVVPLGVDGSLLSLTRDPEPLHQRHPALPPGPYLLFLARLHPKKGLELLVESVMDLLAQPAFAHWQLLLAGSGEADYVSGLKARIAARDGARNIHFLGWLDGEGKRAALQAAEMLVLPSYQENFGIAVVEAMAAGLPVVVSPHVNLAAEIEAAQAGWVAPMEQGGLRDVLAEALRDGAARRGRGEAGRDFVQRHFAWPAVTEALVALYTRCLDGQPNAAPGAAGKGRQRQVL